MMKAFGAKELTVIAHMLIVVLVQTGTLQPADMAGAEGALGAGIAQAAGLVSAAVVLWKYLHHHGDTKS